MSFSYESDYFQESHEIMNSYHSIDFPVYRSIGVEQIFPQEVSAFAVAPPPALSKSPKSSPLLSSKSSKSSLQITVSSSSFSDDNNDNDLMEFLNESLEESAIASIEDLRFCSLSHTTVYFDNKDNNSSSSEVIAMVTQFLNENQIYNERKGESKWICESIDQCENIKFQVQIFSTPTAGFAVEFLRLRGCSLIFSSIFRKFGAVGVGGATSVLPFNLPVAVENENRIENENEIEKKSVDSIISCLNISPIEAIKMICAFVSVISQYSELLTQICHFLIERKEVSCILTLATHLSHQISHAGAEKLALLSFYDQLIPSLVKYSFDSSQSSFVRHLSSQLMKERMEMN